MLDLHEEEGTIGEDQKEDENEEKKDEKSDDGAEPEPDPVEEKHYDCTYETIHNEEIWKEKDEALSVA